MDYLQSDKFGTLYIVATPIGNLADISSRAIDTLKNVNFIAAEDTRHSKKLLQHFSIKTPMMSFHEHSKEKDIDRFITLLKQSQSIALISDAGTPLISDPGFQLVRRAHEENIRVSPVPGACAAIAALSAAGLPSDRFVFEGFLSAKQKERLSQLTCLKNETRTLIFYEAPHRITALLKDMITIFGEDRLAIIARELTKVFETITLNSLSELLEKTSENIKQRQGEFVVLVAGIKKKEKEALEDQDLALLKILSKELPIKKAVSIVSQITGKKKNQLYRLAIKDN